MPGDKLVPEFLVYLLNENVFVRKQFQMGLQGSMVLKSLFWTADTLFYAIPTKNIDLNLAFYVLQKGFLIQKHVNLSEQPVIG